MKWLLVEDDFDVSGALSRSLGVRGFEVLVVCADGLEALAIARKKSFDVIELDLTWPHLDGLELLQRLRAGGDTTPVLALALTARGTLGERIARLNRGADDSLAKPFDLEALAARLHALTRRIGRNGELRCGLLRHESGSGAFHHSDVPLDLSPREGGLLRTLMPRRDRVVPKQDLRTAVFGGDDAVQPDAIEVLVHRWRKKIAGTNAEVLTPWGVGSLLCDDASQAAQRSGR